MHVFILCRLGGLGYIHLSSCGSSKLSTWERQCVVVDALLHHGLETSADSYHNRLSFARVGGRLVDPLPSGLRIRTL